MSALPRFPLVAFDLDGTLIDHSEPIWKTMHAHFGSDQDRRKRVMAAALAGEISYAAWFAADLDMLRKAGATRGELVALAATLRPYPGAVELVRDLRAAGTRVVVISGGLDLVLDTVLPQVEFDRVYINRIRFGLNGLIAGGEATAYDRTHKIEGLREAARSFGLSVAQAAFVGDGPNDEAVAAVAGYAVAWGGAPPGLRRVCHAVVDPPSMARLRDLLF